MERWIPFLAAPAMEDAWAVALPLLLPLAYILYSMMAHYQRPTPALIVDSLTFIAGFSLIGSLACVLPPWGRAIVLVPLVAFASLFFVGNKICYRFFKDWVHHQMILEWRAGLPIAADTRRAMVGWDWFAGVLLPLGITFAIVAFGQPAPAARSVPISLAILLVGSLLHRTLRGRYFDPDQNNPFMNFLRGWLGELKGVDADRAHRVATHVRPPADTGYTFGDQPEYPLLCKPSTAAPTPVPRFKLGTQKPNIVLIVLESVRALECGVYGASPSFTPCFDALAREGLLFRNFYANGSQTVRGELSLLCSYYDHFGGSPLYLRNPNLRLRSLPEILRERGYETHWISSYTSEYHNKAGFLRSHGVDHFHDDKSMPANLPRINWGPPDEELFAHAVRIFDQRTQPFFAEIMTLTNHWPFAGPYPTTDRTPFISTDKLYTDYTRGIYYTDYALGRFFDLARKQSWFENTIFLITSDHGAWVYPPDLPMSTLRKQEAYFRMPMLWYAPKWIQPGEVASVCSQVDVAPTLLDALGIRSPHAFVGRSMFDPACPTERAAIMMHWHSYNVRRGDTYLYSIGKAYAEQQEQTHGRPDEVRDRGDSSHACFTYAGDLLAEHDPAALRMQDSRTAAEIIQSTDDLLHLVNYLRVRNQVYPQDNL